MSLMDRVGRLWEAFHLITTYAADRHSRAALLRAYRRTLVTTTDRTEIELRLRLNGGVTPLRMRLSDIYTLAEILHERQYAVQTSLPERPVIVDAGANIGVAGLWLRARYPGARLLCIEPEEENFRLLQANLGGLDRVTLVQAAVGKASGTAQLHLAAHGAMHSVVDDTGGKGDVSVPVLRLEDLLAQQGIGPVDLLKLDVEGSELDALEGLGPRLKDVRVIVGEVHERLVDGDAFYRLLERSGFHVVQRVSFGRGKLEGVHAFEVARG
jgi:FkbM family methyltransferase